MQPTRTVHERPIRLFQSLSFEERLHDMDMFFQGNDQVHQTMRRVAGKLEEAKIPYAIVGGMAVNAHRHQRTTKDVDFLLSAEGFATFSRLFLVEDFDRVPGRPRRFVDRVNGVAFDVLIAGYFPGSGRPGPIRYPDPEAVGESIHDLRYVNLPNLIQLKLAARRYQDFADVVNLIRFNDLDESFQTNLHPTIQRDYVECLEEKRREDENEARQDRAIEELIDGEDYKGPSS